MQQARVSVNETYSPVSLIQNHASNIAATDLYQELVQLGRSTPSNSNTYDKSPLALRVYPGSECSTGVDGVS